MKDWSRSLSNKPRTRARGRGNGKGGSQWPGCRLGEPVGGTRRDTRNPGDRQSRNVNRAGGSGAPGGSNQVVDGGVTRSAPGRADPNRSAGWSLRRLQDRPAARTQVGEVRASMGPPIGAPTSSEYVRRAVLESEFHGAFCGSSSGRRHTMAFAIRPGIAATVRRAEILERERRLHRA